MQDLHLLRRLQDEYNEGQDFIRNRKLRQVNQLALLNNLNRGDQNIASTTLFSLFNRVHSSLYSDVLTVKFIPPEDSDYKKTEVLNKLQVNDYREMEKYKLDYDWTWNTAFYGDGYVSTLKWDHERKIMVPEVMNNLMFVYDPFFAEIQQWRYYGTWISRSEMQLKRLQLDGVLNEEVDIKRLSPGMDPDVWNWRSIHDVARMGTTVPDTTYVRGNQVYQLLEWYSHDEDGDKCVYWLDKDFTQILRYSKLELGEDKRWPLVRKQIFREPNSSISISVPDLIEDKHRAKSVLYNLMYIAAKDEANPIYAYNPDVIKDVSQFFQRQVEQHIPMDDIEKGVKRLNMGPGVTTSLLQFVNILNTESTDSIGTTMVQPISQKGKKSATESALAQQIADLTASLQSKILGMGEKDFWSHWYQRYLHFMKDAGQKTISLTNIDSNIFEHIQLDDIKTKFPPKIEILSQRDADYKELVKRRDWMQMYPVVTKTMSPKALSSFNKFVFLPMFVKDSSTIDRIVPKSMDEIKSEQENELLEQNKLQRVSPEEDDEMHLYVHYMAKKTPATWAHIFAHEMQAAQKKKQAEEQQTGDKIKNNTDNNTEAAVPLVQETGDELAKQGGKMKA